MNINLSGIQGPSQASASSGAAAAMQGSYRGMEAQVLPASDFQTQLTEAMEEIGGALIKNQVAEKTLQERKKASGTDKALEMQEQLAKMQAAMQGTQQGEKANDSPATDPSKSLERITRFFRLSQQHQDRSPKEWLEAAKEAFPDDPALQHAALKFTQDNLRSLSPSTEPASECLNNLSQALDQLVEEHPVAIAKGYPALTQAIRTASTQLGGPAAAQLATLYEEALKTPQDIVKTHSTLMAQLGPESYLSNLELFQEKAASELKSSFLDNTAGVLSLIDGILFTKALGNIERSLSELVAKTDQHFGTPDAAPAA
jgi:myosin heavy subunit